MTSYLLFALLFYVGGGIGFSTAMLSITTQYTKIRREDIIKTLKFACTWPWDLFQLSRQKRVWSAKRNNSIQEVHRYGRNHHRQMKKKAK